MRSIQLHDKADGVPVARDGVVETGRFTVLRSAGLPENPMTPWQALPGFRVEDLHDAGLLPQFTHAEAMTAAVKAA